MKQNYCEISVPNHLSAIWLNVPSARMAASALLTSPCSC
ncbi:Uncharacterised protein [Vibrio cholerae]|nr:Uncharacterised protein [Vibrio cholerae]